MTFLLCVKGPVYVLGILFKSDGFIDKSSKQMIGHHYLASISVGSIYILKTILPILTTISKCFQAGVVSFAKKQLKQIPTNETPIAVLKQVQCFILTVMSGIVINVILYVVKLL